MASHPSIILKLLEVHLIIGFYCRSCLSFEYSGLSFISTSSSKLNVGLPNFFSLPDLGIKRHFIVTILFKPYQVFLSTKIILCESFHWSSKFENINLFFSHILLNGFSLMLVGTFKGIFTVSVQILTLWGTKSIIKFST